MNKQKTKQRTHLFRDVMEAYIQTHVLITAVEIDLFDAISNSHHTPSKIAKKINCDIRAIRMLCESLTAIGLLVLKDGEFYLTPESILYLVRSSEYYSGDAVIWQKRLMPSFSKLTNVIKKGKPVKNTNAPMVGSDFFPDLTEILFKPHYASSTKLAEYLNNRWPKKDLAILDIACGSGVWSIAIAESRKNVFVTANDLPDQIEKITKKYVEKHNVQRQYNYLKGDINEVEFRTQKYDVIILGHILHSEGPESSTKLMKRLRLNLKAGGIIVIAEVILDDSREKPLFASLFAINMLINTQQGCVFTSSEIEEMLISVGSENVFSLHMPFKKTPLIIGEF